MMSAPAILGSAVLEGKKLLEGTASIGVDALPLAIAVITAGVSGYLAIALCCASSAKLASIGSHCTRPFWARCCWPTIIFSTGYRLLENKSTQKAPHGSASSGCF